VGARSIFDFCWLLNLLSLFAFYFLLERTLEKYGFSPDLAALTTSLFMLVNVPILRTLGYVQVNLHAANLVLLSLLCYPGSRLLSALALAAAVHLKVSPVLLALAFLANRDLRWGGWFLFWVAGIAGVTVGVNGFSPYRDFVWNIRHVYATSGIVFRENSIDSLVRAVAALLKVQGGWMWYVIGAGKLALGWVGAVVAWRSVRRRTFCADGGAGGVVLNAAPALLVLMVMLSPLVWEHHPVLLSLSYLVLLRGVSSAGAWLWYGFAYFLEFLMPTFDFFPWSYGRLLSPLIWLGLAWRASRTPLPSRAFVRANEWVRRVVP
jgi:hypothetical protein